MARQNRSDIFDPNEVTVLHCIQRAVRRAMLCGVDPISGKSFEHRRQWIRDRLEELAGIFGIDVLGFAIMGNHLHVILRNRPDVVKSWSDEQVARRWWNLFPRRRDEDKRPADPTEFDLNMIMADGAALSEKRRRLSDVSWFMRCLAEVVARRSNAEDRCTGRFWEGRFRSQVLADEAALIACSAYVDLNPVRAGIAESPDESEFTSVKERFDSEKKVAQAARIKTRRKLKAKRADDWLAPVELNERKRIGACVNRTGARASDKGFLPMSLRDYLQLVDWTGRQLRRGKLGRIPDRVGPILERLGLNREIWCDLVSDFGRLFRRFAGRKETLQAEAKKRSDSWLQVSTLI